MKKTIGCGYCLYEKTCFMYDPKINKAKAGCEDYTRFDEKPKNKFKK